MIARRVQSTLPRDLWTRVTDWRRSQGHQGYDLATLMQALVMGMVAVCVTLRDVEAFLKEMVAPRRFGVRGTPSDTTLERVVRGVNPDELRPVVHQRVRKMQRSKKLEVLDSVGISLVAIDGKALGSDPVRKHPEAQAQGTGGTGPFVLRALRAVHVASEVKPIIDQRIIPADAGEADTFLPFVDELAAAYGRSALLECFSVDAGFTSRENMHGLQERDYGFIAALKGDQPTLFEEARRVLGHDDRAPSSGWVKETVERDGGRTVTRWFARVRELTDHNGWTCIRQVWRIRQKVEQGGRTTWEDRYFLTNLPWGRLTAARCLAAVRAHWGIENDANWTTDVVWKEDSRAWVRMDRAMETLGLLRILAFNLLRELRHRALRGAEARAMAYRQLVRWIRKALDRPVDDRSIAPGTDLDTGFS